ncbi:MAG TPA: hypothetical protein PKG67_09485 [Turneriella sp.]|nr:hypothetical protein [Turneriella sp.]HNL55344.1 hypothetical protein [Turneriella sp.]HNN00677.1 hypothetical protein [Turneriella sp.]
MKFSSYFLNIARRNHPEATEETIKLALQNRIEERRQENGWWQVICHLPDRNRIMRVILLDDKETVQNAFYDRTEARRRKQ